MKTLFKTFNIFLLGILAMPSFLLLFNFNNTKMETYGYYCDTNYFETGTSTYTPVEIEYDSYTMSQVHMNRGIPDYSNNTQLNSCAPMAATIVIGYYDSLYENLVPNASVGMWYNGQYYYSAMSSQVREIKEYIYTLMGTNTEAPGTSISQFTAGFTSYVNQQGYNIAFTSCGTINFETYQTYIELQQPIVIFLNSYSYYTGGIQADDGTKLSLVRKSSTNGHVAVCSGYQTYTFTKNGNTWTNKYLVCSFGDGSYGLMDVTDLSCVDATFAVNIY